MGQQHVFWDCDGTLVDSEALAMPAAIDTLVEYFDDPRTFDPIAREELVNGWAGLHFGQMFDMAWEHYRGTPANEEQHQFMVAERTRQTDVEKANVLKALASVETIHGVHDALILAEKHGMVNHVVTSSALPRVLLCLDATDIRFRFDNGDGSERIYSATDTLVPPCPKPSPAIYLHALERAGIGPQDAVAIEDSPSGVRSAVAAGIPVTGFIGGTHIPTAQRAAHTHALLEAGAKTVVTQGSHLRNAIVQQLERALS